jgi:phosphoserine phosphatase
MRGLALTFLLSTAPLAAVADPLPSWNDTTTKAAIIAFVDNVTDPDSPEYVPEAERVAVFDNDGTLWSEQPMYFQLFFALDRFRDMAEADPTLASSDALRAAAQGDLGGLMEGGMEAVGQLVMLTHSGMTVSELQASVDAWITTARHPVTGLPFTDMTYQPMEELLRYLRDEDFQTYIVSGGGLNFMRAFAEEAYGIPPENVIGSYTDASYTVVDGVPMIMQDAGLAFNDDKELKPIGIMRNIGRQPIMAFGNSDGDFQMLEWTMAGEGARFAAIVHHTDAVREAAYDRGSPIGRLERGLDEGPALGFVIIDMANDWADVYSGAD